MRQWKSHKIVEAEPIEDLLDYGRVIIAAGERFVHPRAGEGKSWQANDGKWPQPGDYLVRYEDGYLSWSPKKAFEDGYTEVGDQPRPEQTTHD